jgi:type II secretory pathway component PulF
MAITLKRSTPAPTVNGAKESSAASTHWKKSLFSVFRKPVSTSELIFFNSQLSLMMEIGISLPNALRVVGNQTNNAAFQEIVLAMLKDLEEGKQLSDAMSSYPEIFSIVYVSMVRAGEAGGFLKKTLDGIIVMQEKRQALITQLRSALTYPVMLSIMSIAVIIFVLVGILPKFAVLFSGKETLLPWTTKFLIAASNSLRGYWWGYIAGISVICAGFYYTLRTSWAQSIIDRVLVITPIIGKLTNKIYTCQLLRTIGHLLESSVSIVDALAVTGATFRNRYYVEFVDQLRQHVVEGGQFSRLFAANPYIMESVKQMIHTGEEVGDLPRVMLRLAKFYDGEVERELKTVGSLIEPLALVFLGVVVAVIVSSVILPVFRIAGAVQ